MSETRFKRRHIAAGALAGIVASGAWSQDSTQSSAAYPARPIRMIVANPPGGGTDIFARALTLKTSERWKHSVVVDNRGGASETMGADIVAKATPDGYTLIMLSSTHTITPSLFAKLP